LIRSVPDCAHSAALGVLFKVTEMSRPVGTAAHGVVGREVAR
jgi:hypothetical protein